MKIRRQVTLWVLLFSLCGVNATWQNSLSVQSRTDLPNKQSALYYPAPGDGWQRRRAEDVGMDSALLEQAVTYAKTQASRFTAG